MELTPEDRQRIYTEEKARLEMQEQGKTRKIGDLANYSTCIGLGILAVMILVLAFFYRPTGFQPRGMKPPPERGAVIIIRGIYPFELLGPPICMDTAQGLSEALRWIGKDRLGLAWTLRTYRGQSVSGAARLEILEPGNPYTKVRVLDSGRQCWVVQELVR